MLPIAISLPKSGMRARNYWFLGGFGPRDLASILFVLLMLEQSQVPQRSARLSVTVITVAFSILLHGITAAPFAKAYSARAARLGECEEMKPVADMPLRHG